MSNTATLKYYRKQDRVTQTVLTVPVPSYFRSAKGSDFIMLHSETELTRVNTRSFKIEYDDFFGFCPEGYESITEEEFKAAYDSCEVDLRKRTFLMHDKIT